MSYQGQIVLQLYLRDPVTHGGLLPGERIVCSDEDGAWRQAERVLERRRVVGARILRTCADGGEPDCLAAFGTVPATP